MADMSAFIAMNIEDIYRNNGVAAAQERYRAWFIKTTLYSAYKNTTDTILTTDGYGDCIVTA